MRNALLQTMGKRALASRLSRRQYEAVGKVVCEWAHVESTLRYLIEQITRIEPTTCIKLTDGFGADALMRMAINVARDESKDDNQQPAFLQHLKAAEGPFDDLRIKRNELVHVYWHRAERGKATGIYVKARHRFTASVRKWKTDDILALAYQIAMFNEKLWELIYDHDDGRLMPLPAPNKPRRRGAVRRRRSSCRSAQPSDRLSRRVRSNGSFGRVIHPRSNRYRAFLARTYQRSRRPRCYRPSNLQAAHRQIRMIFELMTAAS